MVQVQKINPVVRAILVVGAAAGLVVGVTFAALNSQATLTGNTISATAGLLLSTDGGETFGGSVQGLSFSGVVLGDSTGVTKTFKIKNASTTPMSLGMQIPTVPTFNGGTVTLTKTHATLTCTGTALAMGPATISSLVGTDTPLTGGNLAGGATADCSLNITFDADAVTGGTSVTSNNFDIRFTGTGVSS